MAKREYTDEEIVDLVKSLPVILEIGEHKLYDLSKLYGYYPDLMDEYYWKRGDWMDLFYDNIENRQPDPQNYQFIRFLAADIKEMLEDEENSEWKFSFIDCKEEEDIKKEFYDQFISINHGVISLLDEWHAMFCLNTHSGLETIFLNIFEFDHTLNHDSWKLIRQIVYDRELKRFSRSNTIKRSEMIRDEVCNDPQVRYKCEFPEFLIPEKRRLQSSTKELNFYDHLFQTFRQEIDEDECAEYNFGILANLFPLMYHGFIGVETLAEFPEIFKPSTAGILSKLSTVNDENLVEFIKEKDGELESKFFLAYLRAVYTWRLLMGESQVDAIISYLTQFFDPGIDYYTVNDILKTVEDNPKPERMFDDI